MDVYLNRGGNSGVVAYEIAVDSIAVKFHDGWNYLYNNGSAGISHIENMKRLATAGQGLNTYISQNVRKSYAKKYK